MILLWLLFFFFRFFDQIALDSYAKSTNCSGLNFKLSPIKWNYCCAACMMMLLLVMAPNLVARFSLVLHALHYCFFFSFLFVSNFSFDSKCAGKFILSLFVQRSYFYVISIRNDRFCSVKNLFSTYFKIRYTHIKNTNERKNQKSITHEKGTEQIDNFIFISYQINFILVISLFNQNGMPPKKKRL